MALAATGSFESRREDLTTTMLEAGRVAMTAALVFAGSGPIVIPTSYSSLSNPGLLRALKAHGVGSSSPMKLPLDTEAAR